MKPSPVRKKTFTRIVLILVACSTLSLGAAGDCDDDVNDLIVSGLQGVTNSLADTAINAFFLTITPEDAGTGGTDGGTPSV